MKTLPSLKAACIFARRRRNGNPDNRHLQMQYERAQRAVEAKEREVFCSEVEK